MRHTVSGRVLSFMLGQGSGRDSSWNAHHFCKWIQILAFHLFLLADSCVWICPSCGAKALAEMQLDMHVNFTNRNNSIFVYFLYLACGILYLEGFCFSCWVKALEGIRFEMRIIFANDNIFMMWSSWSNMRSHASGRVLSLMLGQVSGRDSSRHAHQYRKCW